MIAKDREGEYQAFRPEAMPAKRLIVRHCRNAHPHLCDYYLRTHSFGDLCRLPYDSGIKSKVAHFRDLIIDLIYLLRNLRRIRQAQEIVAIGVMACNVALLSKLGLLPSCRKIYWFGLFIHSPLWLRILRPALRALDSVKIHYVLFSKFERPLYARLLSLDEGRLVYVPYGDLRAATKEKATANASEVVKDVDFYFSGGLSNRDYLSLIEAFKSLSYNLVIICSPLNTEVNESILPANIKVLRGVPSETFDAYVRASKACIIPIAHDTGAAGQSCLLRYMKNRKIIIATDTGIIREYIEDGVSGILVRDNGESMAKAIRAVNANFEQYRSCAVAAYDRYVKFFSGAALAHKLDQLLERSPQET